MLSWVSVSVAMCLTYATTSVLRMSLKHKIRRRPACVSDFESYVNEGSKEKILPSSPL